jgi:dihydroflavonol-4-reductase
MKIAITGATGHLGVSILPLLLIKGFEVRALINASRIPVDFKEVEIINGNLFDETALQKLVTGCDVVIHSAAKISMNSNNDPKVYETNFTGTKNIFNAAVEAGVKRFIYVSSIHAYQQLPNTNLLNEHSAYCDSSAPQYDQSKRDAQQYVLQQKTKMEVVVINPTSVAGPPDYRPSLFGKALMDIYNHKIPMLINGGFDFCDVRDVANAIVTAIEKGKHGEAYLLGGKWYSMAEVYKMVMDYKDEKSSINVLPGWVGYVGLPFIKLQAKLKKEAPLYTSESLVALQHGNRNISCEKAKRELNYTSRSFTLTVTDLLNGFKQSSKLK